VPPPCHVTARGNILPASVDAAPTWSERFNDIQKIQTSPCPAVFFREPQEHSQGTQQWLFDIVLLITTAGVLLPIPSPPAAIGDSSLGSLAVALGASEKSCQRNFLLVARSAWRVSTFESMDFYIANHKDSTYRTTFVYVVIDIAAPAQTRNTSRVLGWGALAFMANHAGGKEVNEARRSHTCSRPCTFKEKKKPERTKKSAPPKTHHESHSSPATTTASRRHVMKHV